MAFFVWAALTALALAAGLALALRVGPALRLGEQIVAAVITAVAIVAAAAQLLGYTNLLYGWALGGLVGLSSAGILAGTRPPRARWIDLGRRLRRAARASISPGSLVVIVPASLLLVYLAAYVWLLPTWAWDALWYHNSATAYAIQDHSLRWHDSAPGIPFINAFPKIIELLDLWNVILLPDDRLIDGVQLPMSLMGVVALASLCRRVGASPSVSFGLGLCWLLFPAVFLNIPSSYNDVAIGSIRLAVILFLARLDSTRAHRVFGALALGLYVGSKNYGAQHALMLAPIVALALWLQVRRGALSRWRAVGEAAAMSAGILLLGGATYIRDLLFFGNPVWPAKISVFGRELNGTWAMNRFNKPPWGGPDDLKALWKSFTYKDPLYEVDVRSGGFGPLWVYALLPLSLIALVVVLVRLRRKRPATGALSILMLLVTALLTTAKWWPRHTLGLPAAGLISVALLVALSRRAWVGQAAVAAIAVFAFFQGTRALKAFQAPVSLLVSVAQQSPQERAATKIARWTPTWLAQRERIMQPGDAAIYDESATFIYALWRYDLKNRVLFRPLKGNATEQWLKGLEQDGARWAAVRKKGPAEQALKGGGWTFLSACAIEPCDVWIRPRPGTTVSPNLASETAAPPAPEPTLPFPRRFVPSTDAQ